jgi:uncharacterized protein
MGSPALMKVVLDTNIILSALLFHKGSLGWFRTAWENALFIPLVNRETSNELLRVLAYPKFKLTPNEIKYLFEYYLQFTETVAHSETLINLPICRDGTDQKFLHLAINGHADVLVTGDNDLLVLQGQTPFEIETATTFKLRFPI